LGGGGAVFTEVGGKEKGRDHVLLGQVEMGRHIKTGKLEGAIGDFLSIFPMKKK